MLPGGLGVCGAVPIDARLSAAPISGEVTLRNFALTGVAGFVAPRHLKAIRDTGGTLAAAVDPHDAVGVLDSYFPEAAFFTEFERFERHLEKLRRGPAGGRINYVSICAPNHLHDSHIRLALRLGSDAICEKPLVIRPWNLEALQELEAETGRRVFTVLQLRVHPALVALRERLQTEPPRRHQVRLTYVTSRGVWYRYSWKGSPEKSGGVLYNIGIHFFDLLQWLFGEVRSLEVHLADPTRGSGFVELERADVSWFLSLERSDLPLMAESSKKSTFRSISIDGTEIEFTDGFADLHSKVYEETVAGRGFGIAEARPSIELVHRIRSTAVSAQAAVLHPFVDRVRAGEVR